MTQPATTDAALGLLGLTLAAAELGITRRTVERLIARGVLPAVRLRGVKRTFVRRRDLERLLEPRGSQVYSRKRGTTRPEPTA